MARIVVPCGACDRALLDSPAPRVRCVCGREVRVWRFRPFRMAARARPVLEGGEAPCAYHAGNAAVTACERCGSFLCALCATPIGGRTYCTGCFERLRAEGGLPTLRRRFPRPHAGAALLGFVSLIPFAVVLTGPLAAWQGIRAARLREQISERERGLWGWLALTALLVALGLAITVQILRETR